MKFELSSDSPAEDNSDCIIVGVYADGELSADAEDLDAVCGHKIAKLCKQGDINGKLEETWLLHDLPGLKSPRVLVVGLGKKAEFGPARYNKACRAAASALGHNIASAGNYLPGIEMDQRSAAWRVRQAAAESIIARYRYTETKSKTEDDNSENKPLTTIKLALDEAADNDCQAALIQGQAIGTGTCLTRELGNLPGNICTPSYLANEARNLADQYDSISCTILEEDEMAELGMDALLSVSRGSRQPAKLIIMEYQGGKNGDAPVALVGKGLTFDAGGISLKPAAAMDEMKFDMCGGASVFGALKACAEMQLPMNVIGVVPSSENLPDGDANKPGDVVTSMSGQTIEVLNTDAEGRLILCDALTYTERFKPVAVVDIATLTGACVVALGAHASGLLSNDDDLADELLSAGETSCDRAWRLPLWDDYQQQLDSNFADMANVGGREAGTITAACFLARYTKNMTWAHLDIAGTAWNKGKGKGASGRPVGLLTEFLMKRAGVS
ncbi:MAG: leucyl aminopeptidase [Gammaproteobacteria bacterium]|nr:leucyl aminopeptidase [Gammaproteobacteria bacterium]